MPKKNRSIPVNSMTDHAASGIAIEEFSMEELQTLDKAALADLEDDPSAHRHDSHSFFLLQTGTVQLEIDFQHYVIKAPSIIYVHPDQVHRTITSKDVIVSCWALTDENLNPEYLHLLKEITPANSLALTADAFSTLTEAVAITIKLAQRKGAKLYHSLLKDSCNTLVGLVISLYLELAKPTDTLSRFEVVTKAFRDLLERDFITAKRPGDYADKLHLSAPYLNECVKNATGYPVSYHIQQRIILEAKRLLYHSDKTVKEISAALGYDDYPYFSRLFTKVTGISAVAFRNKNFD